MKLASIDSIKDRAKVKVPGDYGKKTTENLELEWKKYSVEEAREMLESINGGGNEDEIIADALINIVNLTDDAGQKIPFTTELLEQAMNIDYIRKAIIESFMTVQFGREVLKQKN